jgi:hypothetical protein
MGSAERLLPFAVVLEMKIRTEGTEHELDLSGNGRPPVVTEPQVEPTRDARELGLLPADVEHAGRRVDPDDVDAGGGYRDRDAARADPELHDGPRCARGFFDVEGNVLDDAPAPRVVQPRDRVVGARGGGF